MHFTKMEGIGNDYVYVVDLDERLGNLSELAKRVSDRHFGIGSDGLIVARRSTPEAEATPEAGGVRYRMRMFNADGSEGEMCGNGLRCFAKFLQDEGLESRGEFQVQTGAGIKTVEILQRDQQKAQVRVNMGAPILEGALIPAKAPGQVVAYPLEVEGQVWPITSVSMGNPHAVTWVDDVDALDLVQIGPHFEHHPFFPHRVNTEFVRVLGPDEAQMRVWERGSGETLACGTGACAVLVAGVLEGRLERRATVHLRGGDLRVEWVEDGPVFLTGPATTVFTGSWG